MNRLLVFLLTAAALLLPHTAAAEPDREERVERRERAPSPYSNRTQARKREIREAVREATQDDTDHYRFRRVPPRKPKDD